MQHIKHIIDQKHYTGSIKENKKNINVTYEIAHEFATYVGLDTVFVMKLFKSFGQEKVLGLRSYLKDVSLLVNKRSLIIWKLQGKDK